MKLQTAGIVCAFLLAGCAPEAVKGYVVGQEARAAVGSPIASWSPKGEMTPRGVWEQPRMELIYGGISGSTLKVSFKEYENYFGTPPDGNIPQPTSKDLTYDISSKKEIEYGDLRILVISADPQEIVFKVLKGPGETAQVQTAMHG